MDLGTVNSVNFCVFGNTFYHENRKKSQIVVFPWVLIKSVIVLYLVFRAFTAFEILCLLIFHTLTAANHRLSTAFSESNFFFENLGIGIIIGLFSFTHGSTSIEFPRGDPVPLYSNLVADLVGCWSCSNGLLVYILYVIRTDSLLV